ncbi:MAG: filamentous hemagglutinin N-terminal protein [Hyphomicrobiales bacterium]|nr:filamentous hemagglutinin N-terminal protein [Hyphomicrobiales bacterium]
MIALRVHRQVSKCSRLSAPRRWGLAASAIFRIALSALVLFHGTWNATAQTLPSGGRVVGGQAVIGTPSAAGLNVTQSSQRAVIDWTAFSIGAGQAVTFQQPGSGAALLNRVTGDTPSNIAGSLNANGQIYLLNPNGIAITPSGAVATGAFVGSTLDIHNDDFMAGRMKFTGSGQSASVSNAGRITTRSGGYVALLGGTVENSGIITSELGRVALGSGESATLDLEGDGFLQVAIPSVGKAGRTLVENSGSIAARGGRVELRAATAREAVRNVVNMPGSISASSVSSQGGVVVIDGGEVARVQISGRVSARGRDAAGGSIKISGDQLALDKARIRAGSKTSTGGSIEMTGRDIGLRSATLDASGATGGGKIRVGGDFYGRGAIKPAETTTVENSNISANSTSSGDAGSVVVWADGTTRFSGVITARALGSSGNGGQAEVSGKTMLVYDGTTDLRAYNGRTGTLLLDPHNVTINTAASTGGFTASADNTIINVTTLQNALATANVEISTGSTGTQAGNITVSNAVTWSSGNLLTLTAAGSITVNGSLTSTSGGGITLNAGVNIGVGAASALNVGAGAGSGVWMQAAGNITTATGSSITTQGHDVTMASDRDGSGSGSIGISGTAINTNGGSATFSGGSGTLSDLRTTGYAEGFGATSRAIDFRNSQLNTGSGSIWMRGRGGDTASTNSYGVWLGNNATVTSTTGGIYLDGVAIGTATNTYHNGVLIGVASIASAGGEIVVTGRGGNTTADGQSGVTLSSGYITNSGAGTITVNATSPTVAVTGTSYALRLSSNSEIRSSGSGEITLNTIRNAGAVGFYLENSHVGLGTLAGAYTGNLAINSDTFVLAGVSTLKGSGGLSLAPVTASSTIAIAGTGTATLDLTAAELAMIQPGFSSITIGSAGGTGAVDVRNWSANAPLAIRGGAIALNGSLASTGDVTLTGSSYAFNTATVQATSLGFGNANPVTLTGAANLNLSGASTVSNALSGSGSLTKLGAGTLALAGANTYAGGTTISAGTLQIGNGGTTGSLAPGAIVNNGTLAFSRSDAIAISNQVTGSGLITATTGGLTVSGDWNVGSIALVTTAGGSITLAAAMSASNVALTAAGSVTESGAGTLTAAALSASAGANITLAAASNSIGVFAASAAGSIALNQSGALTIGTSGGIAGITANGEIAIRSTGAMAIQQAVTTTNTGANALLLVAGDGTAAGLSTGGDMSASGAASISVGAGGLARLYTGSISGSATAALIGTPGGYRYGSNLTTQAYGRALGAGVNVIYREQPVLGVTLDTGGSLTRVYDGSTTTALVNLTNAANGDSFSPINVGSARNAGSYTFDTASVTNDLGYAIASGSWQYDITRRAATITIQAQTRAYGDVNPALAYTTQNVVAGDVFPGELATTATVTSNVGVYAITAGTLASPNYDLTFQGANLSVTPRALSVVADAKTRVYGDANPALTYVQTGLVNGDTLQGALATSAGAASNVGVYAITQGDLAASTNYALT